MAAGVAHEVGNPLAAMSAILQRREWQTNPTLRRKCTVLSEQVQRISCIVDELRQFARPVGGRQNEEGRVNANEALRLAVQIGRYDPRSKNVRVRTDLDPEAPRIGGSADDGSRSFSI